MELAEKLRAKVEGLRIPVDGEKEPVRTTISMGVAAFSDALHQPKDLIAEADQALYHTKQNGRNRVAAYFEVIDNARGRTDSIVDRRPWTSGRCPARSPCPYFSWASALTVIVLLVYLGVIELFR